MSFFSWLGSLFDFGSSERAKFTDDGLDLSRLTSNQRKTVEILNRRAERFKDQRLKDLQAYRDWLKTPREPPEPLPGDTGFRTRRFAAPGSLPLAASEAAKQLVESLPDQQISAVKIVSDAAGSRIVGLTDTGEEKTVGSVRYVAEAPNGSPMPFGIDLGTDGAELKLTVRYPKIPRTLRSPSLQRQGDLAYRVRAEAAMRRARKRGTTTDSTRH